MAFDGIACSTIVNELNTCLINGKINKIFQPNNNEILLGIYNMGKNYALDVCIDAVNYRICLSTHNKKNPKNVFNFCMVLRKHLTGGTIKNIYMNGLERVVYIDVECYNELNDLVRKTLIVELMGRHSNVVLVNQDNIIIDSLRHLNKLDNSLRDIMPGVKYVAIQSNKKDFTKCSFDAFYNAINKEDVVIAISSNFTGISRTGICEILKELQIDEKNITLENYKVLYQHIKKLINKKTELDSFPEFNFSIDDYYYEKEEKELLTNKRNYLLGLVLSRLKKLEGVLKNIEKKLEECKDMDLYKLYGELITANLYRIDNYNRESVIVENYYNNNEKIKITLDPKISPSDNAKKYFKKYKKLQNTKGIVSKQRELVENEIQYLDSIVYDINNCNSIEDIEDIYSEIEEIIKIPENKTTKNKNIKASNEPAEYNVDGFIILVGKNNKQKDYLTCKMAKSKDLWFHTKDIHGSHVVLRLDKNIKAPDSVIYKCAQIAAYFSKAKMSQNVPVDYTYIKYVKKPNGAKPGMVTYTDNKTLYVNPQKPE